MHLVTKQIKNREYFYLVEKERQGKRVVTSRTVYIGDRQKMVDLLQGSATLALPSSFSAQSVGGVLALANLAEDLGIESLIDKVCPVRQGAAPVGRRLLIAAVTRATTTRRSNGLCNLRSFYEGCALSDILPIESSGLDDRRMHEMLSRITAKQIEEIEAAVVERLIEREKIRTNALAFDCTNFDSYAGAKNSSRLLQRGHSKSHRPLRVMGLGILVSDDDGMPLLTFVYPGNENDIKSFGRFLRALDRRRDSLDLSIDATVAADGGNISQKLLRRMEKDPRYYVIRLPARHLTDLERCKHDALPKLDAKLNSPIRAKKYHCAVYGVQRCVVDVYSKRMHQRQLPGLRRDRDRARADLIELQRLLERQRKGLRRSIPITLQSLENRVAKVLSREHMKSLFRVTVTKAPGAPVLKFLELSDAWAHLDDYVLGRTLLVTNRADWTPEQIVRASRLQSHNENLFRDVKDSGGVTMLPLRHRRDSSLRAHALIVILGLMLGKVLQRRVKAAGIKAPSMASVIDPLKDVLRARVFYPPDAPPALRALAADIWVPAQRTPRQQELLTALNLQNNKQLGTTLAERLSPKKQGRRKKIPS
jgi:transposase